MDSTHLVVDETAGRESLYVGMSRGRERNTAYVITERARAADLSPDPRAAPDLADPGTAEEAPPARHRLAVLAGVMERQQSQRTATETMRGELERAASLATLAPMWADVTRAHAARRYEDSDPVAADGGALAAVSAGRGAGHAEAAAARRRAGRA